MSRKRDYKWFMGGIRASMLSISQSSDFDSESSLTRSAIMAAGKSVKFDDENTLERRQRQTEIDTQKKNDGGWCAVCCVCMCVCVSLYTFACTFI